MKNKLYTQEESAKVVNKYLKFMPKSSIVFQDVELELERLNTHISNQIARFIEKQMELINEKKLNQVKLRSQNSRCCGFPSLLKQLFFDLYKHNFSQEVFPLYQYAMSILREIQQNGITIPFEKFYIIMWVQAIYYSSCYPPIQITHEMNDGISVLIAILKENHFWTD